MRTKKGEKDTRRRTNAQDEELRRVARTKNGEKDKDEELIRRIRTKNKEKQ